LPDKIFWLDLAALLAPQAEQGGFIVAHDDAGVRAADESLKTLKNKLSEYVRLASGGETVLVTDRDRVVAEIGPPNPARSSMLSDALLLDAFRQGWMTPPISVGRGPPARKPVMTIDELLNNLQRDRADR
jgi:antitoxin (DNA-binding transcriptional repressor) of toxin-antitoxin stability system